MGDIKKCIKCSAKDAPEHFQDTIYGKGVRLHTESTGCTVCGRSKYEEDGWADDTVANKMMGVRFVPKQFRHNYPPSGPLKVK